MKKMENEGKETYGSRVKDEENGSQSNRGLKK